jgi:nitrite reductase/ring-hydroxylating ferredoxin subunit/uncharacterized membrane protein
MALQEAINDVIDQQTWLEPASEGVQHAVTTALQPYRPATRPFNDLLNGTWLGHPLHPVLTDIPIGAWTVTALLDTLEMMTGRQDFTPGADAALGLGVVGALGSAVTGLADWQYTVDMPRRTGLIHALLNASATALYATSWLLRRAGKRGAGHVTALLGFGLVTAGGYLGGDLVFRDRLTVDHAPEQTPPDTFTPVLADAELPEGGTRRVQAGDVQVMLARQGGQIYALAESCSHLGGPLSEGTLEGNSVICPWHGSRFNLSDGSIVHGPATCPQPHYETRVRDGQIEMRNLPRAVANQR